MPHHMPSMLGLAPASPSGHFPDGVARRRAKYAPRATCCGILGDEILKTASAPSPRHLRTKTTLFMRLEMVSSASGAPMTMSDGWAAIFRLVS